MSVLKIIRVQHVTQSETSPVGIGETCLWAVMEDNILYYFAINSGFGRISNDNSQRKFLTGNYHLKAILMSI